MDGWMDACRNSWMHEWMMDGRVGNVRKERSTEEWAARWISRMGKWWHACEESKLGGRIDGWLMDEQINGSFDRWTETNMGRWISRCEDGRMGRWIKGEKDGRKKWVMGELMDEWKLDWGTNRKTEGELLEYKHWWVNERMERWIGKWMNEKLMDAWRDELIDDR